MLLQVGGVSIADACEALEVWSQQVWCMPGFSWVFWCLRLRSKKQLFSIKPPKAVWTNTQRSQVDLGPEIEVFDKALKAKRSKISLFFLKNQSFRGYIRPSLEEPKTSQNHPRPKRLLHLPIEKLQRNKRNIQHPKRQGCPVGRVSSVTLLTSSWDLCVVFFFFGGGSFQS